MGLCKGPDLSDILLSDSARQECDGLGEEPIGVTEGLRGWELHLHRAGRNPGSATAWLRFSFCICRVELVNRIPFAELLER